MDEMLDRLKTNISTEDNKRLETILQEKEKFFCLIIDNQTKQIDDLKRFIVEKDNKYISLLIDKDESYKEQIDLLREEILELSRMVLNLQEQLREHTIILSKHSSDIENLKSETRHKLDMVEMSKYESVLREKLDLEDLLKTLQKEKLDMVEMSNSKYESVLREKLELEDLLKTLQKEKMDLEETHKKLQTTHIQCKFDEEVFKNLERNYHTLTAKFTKITVDKVKSKQKNIDICLELIEMLRNLNTNSTYFWLQGLNEFMVKVKTLEGIEIDTSQVTYVLSQRNFNGAIIPPLIISISNICNDIRNEIEEINNY